MPERVWVTRSQARVAFISRDGWRRWVGIWLSAADGVV